MIVVPLTLKEANSLIADLHRHNKPARGCKFALGAMVGDKLVGVAVCGRPVARRLDDALTLEVLRVCTDGTRNACSFLYAACRRVAQTMGYRRVVTYTLASEDGASLRAAGARAVATVKAAAWTKPSRPRGSLPTDTEDKVRWELIA